MKLFFPDNFFSQIIVNSLPDNIKTKTEFLDSALIAKEIQKSDESAGLIPTMDLITNKELIVSKKFGISFEETLCNSYLYFKPAQKDVNNIYLHGDISSIEVILTKILFKETYNTGISANIITELKGDENNVLIAGNKNFENEKFLKGLSFSEKIIETISLPYVNYVLASTQSELVLQLNDSFNEVGEKIYNYVDETINQFHYSELTKDHIKNGISSFIFKFAQQDLDGIDQLLRLPYFHGIIDDIIEVKFV